VSRCCVQSLKKGFDTARSLRVCQDQTIVRGKALSLDIVEILSKWGR
jgi:hypothetical protein